MNENWRRRNKLKVARIPIVLLVLAIAVAGVLLLKYNLLTPETQKNKQQSQTPVNLVNNNANITSNLTMQDSLPEADRKIDLEIEKELGNSNNTFQKPLVIQDPFEVSPLTAVVVFTTDKESSIRMTIEGDIKADTFVHEYPVAKKHRISIIGLYADRENKVKLEQIINGKTVDVKELKIRTEKVPEILKDAVHITNNSTLAVPGITIISGLSSTMPYAFDSSGNVRWYIKFNVESHGYFPLSNGRFMLMNTDVMVPTFKRPYSSHMYEMDFLGRIHNIFLIPNGTHHDVTEKTSGGNLMVLSNSLEGHVEDLLMELDRDTGEIVKQIKLEDVLKDAHFDVPYDWSHINTFSYQPDEDTVLISPRNISSAIKLNWTTGQIKWILSDPSIWKGTPYEKYVLKLIGTSIWFYQQHAVYQMPDDLDKDPNTRDIMLFDNRNINSPTIKLKVSTGIGKSWVTQFAVNENEGTVKQVRTFPNSYSEITSNYNMFYSQNRLISYHADTKSGSQGEIYEYEYSTGKIIRSYTTKDSFYRGYRQEFAFDASNQPMKLTDNPIKGIAAFENKLSSIPAKPDLKLPDQFDMYISGGILYMKVPFLSVSSVELVGSKSAWASSFAADTKLNITNEAMKKGSLPKNSYTINIAIPVKQLSKDNYEVYINFYGVLVYTNAQFTIK